MKNVVRSTIPNSLKDNGRKWTKDLLRELEKRELKTSDPLFSKYNEPDVKNTLNVMYENTCCYCEANLHIVDYPHIEHRKPKSTYPQDTYNWDNLHLACEKCNMRKGKKYDEVNPILDSVSDVPISDHLKYVITPIGAKLEAKSPRGRVTIDHTDLNRDELVDARTKIFHVACNIFLDVKGDPNNPRVPDLLACLEDMVKDQYGSLIEYCRDRFLNSES